MILVKEHLDFKLISSKIDPLGRYIFLEVEIQDSPFVLLNIYAPNKCAEQCVFFSKLSEELKDFVTDEDKSVVIGGDFNVILDPDLDGRGGNKKRKDSVRYVEDMIIEHDLVDIWRIRNPTDTRFTWRQKSPLIQRRLDYWLISNDLQEDVESVEIITAIKSDHSAIALSINGLDENERGPSFWKFNSTLINDQEYCNLLRSEYKNWLEEFKEVNDKRVLWDLIKYKIRQRTIIYSKAKARKKREKVKHLEESLRDCTTKCDNNPSKENLDELECLQAEYDQLYDYITQGAIIRSRATWYELGEKNNKYFLNLEKSNKKKSSVRKIFTRDGKLTNNPKKIMDELESFYADLYDGSSCPSDSATSMFLDNSRGFPALADDSRKICEGKLGYSECFSVLGTFPKNKTPGNDGLTIEFYLAFWPLFGRLLVDSLNYAFEFGELSNSQKQAIITLIEKKGKDKRMIRNWRPISLINVDAKIASKTLAKRLEKVLPEIIHSNQNAFVKGRSIFDAIRTIDDLMEYTKEKDLPGILVAIDFEKAFDTLNLNFLIRTLHKFNFGPSFIQWIRTLYKNVKSCVMNNGFTTGPFTLSRGVRQGDPLSPYLFIIALETLTIKIRNDDSIKGFKIGGETTKLSLFADDMTCFVRDKESYASLFAILESFGSCSGLRVNHEKTEILALGNSILHEKDFNNHRVCEIIKILGVYFGYDEKQRNDLNFRQTLKSIKKSINMWKWRNLSLLGKIQIIKTFAIPKLMFRASVIPISNDLVKEANSIFYNFIWNGKDKVKRCALISDIDKGGLKMLDIESMVSARRVICLKKFLEDYPSTWKSILNSCILPVGGSLVLHCNFDTVKLKTQLPKYYKECFDAWSGLNSSTPVTFNDIMNEIIWNNKFICIDKKSVYRNDLVNLGIVKVGDLITDNNLFLHEDPYVPISPEQRFFIMGVVHSLPSDWKTIIRSSVCTNEIKPIPCTPYIKLNCGSVPISDVTSKQIYDSFLRKKQTPPTAQQKLTDKYSETSINWEKVYSLPFRTTLDSKLREFQYKILNNIVFTNDKLFRFGLSQSPNCTFCNEEPESIEHLLSRCKVSSEFWKEVLSWLKDNNIIIESLNEIGLFLGNFEKTEDFFIINHILLLGKYYIYVRKCHGSLPSLRGFIARIRRVYNIELHIARERNKLTTHFKKWEKLVAVMNTQ